jgi:ABC-type multidrug transport system ATPase subunit
MKKPPHCTIIGIVGNHASGKSTLADWLAEQLHQTRPDLEVVRLNFADALREELAEILPFKPDKAKRHPYERQALVFVGESWREYEPRRYVRKYLERLSAQRNRFYHTVVITDDVYHFNEREVCDLVVYIRNMNYDPPEGYTPVSVRETLAMLDQAEADSNSLFYTIWEPQELEAYRPRLRQHLLRALEKDAPLRYS